MQAELIALQIEKINDSNGISDEDIEGVVTKSNVLQPNFDIEEDNDTWILSGNTLKGNAIHDIVIQKYKVGITLAETQTGGIQEITPPASARNEYNKTI